MTDDEFKSKIERQFENMGDANSRDKAFLPLKTLSQACEALRLYVNSQDGEARDAVVSNLLDIISNNYWAARGFKELADAVKDFYGIGDNKVLQTFVDKCSGGILYSTSGVRPSNTSYLFPLRDLTTDFLTRLTDEKSTPAAPSWLREAAKKTLNDRSTAKPAPPAEPTNPAPSYGSIIDANALKSLRESIDKLSNSLKKL